MRMRQPPRPAAARADRVKLRISVFANGESKTTAIKRKRSATVCSGIIRDATAGAARQIDYINIRIAALIARVSNLARVGTNRRMHADYAVVRHLPYIRAVVIGDINFF